MKFTKEKAFEELKSRLTANGEKLNISERSLMANTETLMSLVDEGIELEDFTSKFLPFLVSLEGNYRSDYSQKAKEIRKEIEDEYSKKQANNTNKNIVDVQANANNDEITKALERIAALETQLSEASKQKKIEAKKSNLVAKMTEYGVTDADWARSFIDNIVISEDMDVDTKAKDFAKLYNKSVSDAPYDVTPLGSQGSNKSNIIIADEFKDVMDIVQQNNGNNLNKNTN